MATRTARVCVHNIYLCMEALYWGCIAVGILNVCAGACILVYVEPIGPPALDLEHCILRQPLLTSSV
jgi:hypothetical protein